MPVNLESLFDNTFHGAQRSSEIGIHVVGYSTRLESAIRAYRIRYNGRTLVIYQNNGTFCVGGEVGNAALERIKKYTPSGWEVTLHAADNYRGSHYRIKDLLTGRVYTIPTSLLGSSSLFYVKADRSVYADPSFRIPAEVVPQ